MMQCGLYFMLLMNSCSLICLTFIPKFIIQMYTFSGKFSSKQSTDKELAKQRAEIEALQKKLDAQSQNIQETKLSNSEGIISCFYLVSHSQTQPTVKE